ncbi:MAG: YbaK/EbsC family protein [Actinomycetota bacterium]
MKVEKLFRADADFVKSESGFSIGGVSPVGWISTPLIIIDNALHDYEVIWAAAGHPHAVFPTTFDELVTATSAHPMNVGD